MVHWLTQEIKVMITFYFTYHPTKDFVKPKSTL